MAGPDEIRFIGVLVHRGVVGREDAEAAMRLAQAEGLSPAEALVRLGTLSRPRLELLRRTDGEDVPGVPGFEILGLAGKGGTAFVVHAREKKTGRELAIKQLRAELLDMEEARRSFMREARLLIRLDHENVVKGEKVGTWQGRLIFFMEYVPGRSLQDLLREGKTFHEDAGLYIILQVARALTYLSEQGVVHRDIKPGNVLLTARNQVKLIDLGFAASVGSGEEVDGDTTVGTVAYISPEQARGESDLDVRSDIYSLGATLYQLVVGELPFSGESNQDVMAAQILESLSSEVLHQRRISPHMRYFIEKMMAKEREVRYQSPQELIQDIEEQIRGKKTLEYNPDAKPDEELLKKPFEDGEQGPPPPPPPPPRFPTRRRRR